MNIIDVIVVFCAYNDVTRKAGRKWSAATCLEEREAVRPWLLVIATGLCLIEIL